MSNAYASIAQLCARFDTRTLGSLSNDQNTNTPLASTVQAMLDDAAGEFESGISGYVPLPLPPVIQVVQGASIGIASATLTCTTGGGPFVQNDIGKPISVALAGTAGANLITTVLAFTSPTSVTLALGNQSGVNLTSTTFSYPVMPLICTRWVCAVAAARLFGRRSDKPKQIESEEAWATKWMEDFRMRKVSIPGVGRNAAALIAGTTGSGRSIYDNIFGLPTQRRVVPGGMGPGPNPPGCN